MEKIRSLLIRSRPELTGFPGPFVANSEVLNTIFPGFDDVTVNLDLPNPLRDGHASAEEYRLLAKLFKYHTRARRQSSYFAVEIGGFDGVSARQLCLNAAIELDFATLTLPDNTHPVLETDGYFNNRYEHSSFPLELPPQIGNARIAIHYGDSAFVDIDKITNGHSIDFAFIDGCHSYSYCKNDTEMILSGLSPGGMIVWHDYGKAMWPGVTSYLNEISRQGKTILWLRDGYEIDCSGGITSLAFYLKPTAS